MATQLLHYGYRSVVCWSDEDGCFIGCLIDIGEDFVSFHGETAVGLQEPFRKAAHEYMTRCAEERRTEMASQVPFRVCGTQEKQHGLRMTCGRVDWAAVHSLASTSAVAILHESMIGTMSRKITDARKTALLADV